VPILVTARRLGFGCGELDQIEVLGDALPATPCPDFQMARLMPVKFSFLHICRSIARQILLLARGKESGQTSKDNGESNT